MADLEIRQFPCLSDNYGVLVLDKATGATASIDAPEAGAVKAALAETGWSLSHILVTHHHLDHTGGIEELKGETGCEVVGPRGEADKVPGIDVKLAEGDAHEFGSCRVQVIEVGGHTTGHIAYHLPDAKVAFVGDALFALGCGRVFEGTAEMMWRSLDKLRSLPPDTAIYCGHEYTLSNAEFAITIEPENEALQARVQEIRMLREKGEPTVPTTIGRELETNPFLRASSAEIRARLGLEQAEDWQVFAEVRRRKDAA